MCQRLPNSYNTVPSPVTGIDSAFLAFLNWAFFFQEPVLCLPIGPFWIVTTHGLVLIEFPLLSMYFLIGTSCYSCFNFIVLVSLLLSWVLCTVFKLCVCGLGPSCKVIVLLRINKIFRTELIPSLLIKWPQYYQSISQI